MAEKKTKSPTLTPEQAFEAAVVDLSNALSGHLQRRGGLDVLMLATDVRLLQLHLRCLMEELAKTQGLNLHEFGLNFIEIIKAEAAAMRAPAIEVATASAIRAAGRTA